LHGTDLSTKLLSTPKGNLAAIPKVQLARLKFHLPFFEVPIPFCGTEANSED
jgi:hypothetical protein